MTDDKDVSYASRHPGVAHACGHDVHTTIVLGAALYLAHHRDDLPGPVRFVFQPAEERVPGGALDVIGDGGLDGVGAIVGVHCEPKLDVGTIGLKSGAISSAADMAVIRIIGPGGHTARPELTVDLVGLAARIVNELPARVAGRLEDPTHVKLVFGAIQAGDAANVIPTHCELKASIRTPSLPSGSGCPNSSRARSRRSSASPVLSSSRLHTRRSTGRQRCRRHRDRSACGHRRGGRAVGRRWSSRVGVATTSRGSRREVPGTYVRLGVRDPAGPTLDLHAGHFDVDERSIALGVRLLVGAVHEHFRS